MTISIRYASLCEELNMMMDGALTDDRMHAKVAEMEGIASRTPGSSGYMMYGGGRYV